MAAVAFFIIRQHKDNTAFGNMLSLKLKAVSLFEEIVTQLTKLQ